MTWSQNVIAVIMLQHARFHCCILAMTASHSSKTTIPEDTMLMSIIDPYLNAGALVPMASKDGFK
jgi:hypothetical protein